MRKYLFPIRLFLTLMSFLCLILSYIGLTYLTLGWYIAIILLVLAEVIITFYDLFTKRQEVFNDPSYNGLGIGLFLYVMIIYIRLFFDQGILYVEGNLLNRFTFINQHLPILCIGTLGYIIYHLCVEFNDNKVNKKRKRKN